MTLNVPKEYEAEWLECRLDLHQWVSVETVVTSRDVVERVQRCRRCHGQRTTVIDRRTWNIVGRVRYSMPQGYRIRGQGRIDKRDVRESVITEELRATRKARKAVA